MPPTSSTVPPQSQLDFFGNPTDGTEAVICPCVKVAAGVKPVTVIVGGSAHAPALLNGCLLSC